MSKTAEELYNSPGDIRTWPILKVHYATDAEKIAALLPPGIEPSDTSEVHLSFYLVPVPDEPEHGLKITVDADYRGTKGEYAIGYAIDQESAVYNNANITGQPKYLAEVEYYRLKDAVRARAVHQGYTFAEFKGRVTGQADMPESLADSHEWWVKVSPSVTRAEKSYDFPPHVVTVQDGYTPVLWEDVDGELVLRESPWDPITELLPIRGAARAQLVTNRMTKHDIQLGSPLDPEAFWPFVDTIGSSRWPGVLGGPRREVDFSTYLE